ncbi:acetyl-CoA synthetase [Halonotius aquaticus]|uniref:Acetyl-CoA synthetase n=1 Tax=Halonotius aquaticus TaxID=2216978 RepID=A0A3A6Q3E6_9EURY|nr:AMP-binding protein [Halonotius aquaticus]RJX43762.1 acetyl-CoA synthetase [Halonotius aquaticus]
MEASVIGDLLPRDRRREQPAIVVPATDRAMSYHDFFTNAYKSGNVLRFLGVREAATVAVDITPAPEPLLAFLGAAQLGAVTTFEPTSEARVTLVPVAEEAAYDLPPGAKLAVYGGPPESPATTHWEQEVWSENPGFPETPVDPNSPVVRADGKTYSHRDLLAAGDDVVDALALDGDSRLAIRTPLAAPATLVGLVAALAAEATAVLVGDSEQPVDADAALVAADVTAPEPVLVSVDAVSL